MSRSHRPTHPLPSSRRRLGVATGAFVLTAALCGGFAPAASASAASADDSTRASRAAVANPGFESGLSGWVSKGKGTAALETGGHDSPRA